ncbi:hypothetical protein ACFWBF_28515 [Streptomyces sp. NPDC060028]|uniref:hypothetical protein n=1 Tax=Streptomyces sp. NPDC060028 TaxID=3347041 RepID=UPI0036B0501A
MLLFGEGIKTAGSLSLLVSLPTMLAAFARYSRDGSFAVLGAGLRLPSESTRQLRRLSGAAAISPRTIRDAAEPETTGISRPGSRR